MARVLLAEPDRAICSFVAGILDECGHEVRVCENLIEAEVWLATSPIDVLMTDLWLRSDEGMMLGKGCAARGIRTITLTGRELRADRSEVARSPGLHEKPFRFSDLQRVLRAVEAPPSAAPAVARRASNAAA